MATYGDMRNRIAREMKRGEVTACATAVGASIQSAIEYWENEPFWFNEFHAETFSASSSVTTVALPIEPIIIESIKARINTRDYPLVERSWKEIDDVDSGQYYGYPSFYAYHSNLLRLYPPPQENYVLVMAGIRRYSSVSACASFSASNVWTTEAEQMVRLTAKGYLWRDELRNPDMGSRMEMEAERIAKRLRKRTTFLRPAGRTRGHF